MEATSAFPYSMEGGLMFVLLVGRSQLKRLAVAFYSNSFVLGGGIIIDRQEFIG
jgi:hypothetical protein